MRPQHEATLTAARTVASREISLKVRDKSFAISLLVTVGCMIAGLVLSIFLGSRDKAIDVATFEESGRQLAADANSLSRADSGPKIKAEGHSSAAAVRQAVASGKVQLGIVPGPDGPRLISRNSDSPATPFLQQAHSAKQLAANAREAGLDPTRLASGVSLPVQQVSDSSVSSGTIRIAAIGLAVGFYLCALLFGTLVAQSVLEEKQNRIVEIVASLIPLRSLLIGKIIASSVVAFIQVAVIVGALLGILAAKGTPVKFPQLGLTGLWFVVFFVVGYLATAALWAMAGALATRQEDIQHTATPVSMLLMLVIPVGIFLNGTWLAIASYLPIANVVAMPVRVLAGDAAWWEPPLSLALLVVFAYVITTFAATVYRRSLMQTRQRMTVRQALRTAE